MNYPSHRSSSAKAQQEQHNRRHLWRLLWLLPFLWASTLGEVLHHYVELPAQYHCAAEEVHGVSHEAEHADTVSADAVKTGAKVRAHLCHNHHGHDSGHCLACRYLSRITSPAFALAPIFVTSSFTLQSPECKVLSISRRERPVRGPPLLTI